MKILKKVLAVLGVACILFAVAIPCFAWEWTGDATGKLTSPIAPIEYSYISHQPLFGEISGSGTAFTGKGNMLVLALPDTFNIDSTLEKGDTVTKITVYGADEMLYVDKDEAIATVQRIWDTEYESGGLVPLKQFAGCDSVAQIEYTYGSISGPLRYIGEYCGPFGTHVDLLPWILNYQTYNLTSDPETNGLTAYIYYKYRSTAGTWKDAVFLYDGYDTRYFIENDTKDYYQYNVNIGTALKADAYARADFDGQQPFIICETTYVGNTAENGAFRAVRSQNLVGVHDSFAGNGVGEPVNFALLGNGGNMLANMLYTGYVSNVEIPPNAIPPELSNATGFLSTALGGFLDFQIVPGITLGGILATVLCISLFLVFLKVFAGG